MYNTYQNIAQNFFLGFGHWSFVNLMESPVRHGGTLIKAPKSMVMEVGSACGCTKK